MAPSNNQIKEFIRNQEGRLFTLKEATDLQKEIDNFPTGTGYSLIWRNAKAKRIVNIGYNR